MHPNGGIVNGGGHSGLKDMSHHAIDRSGCAIGQVDKVGEPVTYGVVRLAIAEQEGSNNTQWVTYATKVQEINLL